MKCFAVNRHTLVKETIQGWKNRGRPESGGKTKQQTHDSKALTSKLASEVAKPQIIAVKRNPMKGKSPWQAPNHRGT
jgi:hypothetical protein